MKTIFILFAILIIAAGVYAFKEWKAKRKIVPPVAAPAPVNVPDHHVPAVLTDAELIALDPRLDLTRPVTPVVAHGNPIVEPTPPPVTASPTSDADLIALDPRWDMRRPRDSTPVTDAPVVLTEAELMETILRGDRTQ